MAIEYTDGTFGATMPLKEAMAEFFSHVDTGLVRALYVGRTAEIEQRKADLNFSERLRKLENRVDGVEPVKSGIINIPTQEEIQTFTS